MNIQRRVVGGVMSALCVGILLGTLIIPAQARDASVQFVKRHHFPSENVPPGIPQSRRPLYSPPVFMDRGAPISERPLAPIGNGGQFTPESVPFVWCHGQWMRADNLRQGCP